MRASNLLVLGKPVRNHSKYKTLYKNKQKPESRGDSDFLNKGRGGVKENLKEALKETLNKRCNEALS